MASFVDVCKMRGISIKFKLIHKQLKVPRNDFKLKVKQLLKICDTNCLKF